MDHKAMLVIVKLGLRLKNSVLTAELSVTHTDRGAHPCIPVLHLASVNTTELPQMVPTLVSAGIGRGIDHTHDIRREMA